MVTSEWHSQLDIVINEERKAKNLLDSKGRDAILAKCKVIRRKLMQIWWNSMNEQSRSWFSHGDDFKELRKEIGV